MSAPTILRLHADDDVAVAVRPLSAGETIDGLTAATDIPAGHKIAVRSVAVGGQVKKYGQVIGAATAAIAPGDWVHTQNLGIGDISARVDTGGNSGLIPPLPVEPRTFEGYLRADGRVGTRNYLAVVTSVNCSAMVARRIAREVEARLGDRYPTIDGVVAITHGSGCGMASEGEAMDMLRRTLSGYARHPNVAGVLVLGLGCETNQISSLMDAEGLTGSADLGTMAIQEEGGAATTIQRGIDRMMEMADRAGSLKRTPQPVSHLTVGLQCGGSDGYSGMTANPALGRAADLLVAHGATAILSETPEIYGAEHLLTDRAAPDVAAKLMQRIAWWERHVEATGGSLDNNPSAGNKAGGLTTILEKSLGAVAKAGSAPLSAVYEYAEPVTAKGLVFMDTPGYDPVSATGQIAGGATMICFTTGRGSVFGAKPAPSLKLATNSALARRMPDDIDIDCGRVLDEGMSLDALGQEIFETILATASGKVTASEALGFGEDEIQPWRLGATM